MAPLMDLYDLLQQPAWMADAACNGVDTDLFYPDKGDWQTSEAAKAVCQTCPVQQECLDYADTPPVEIHGVWGGLSSKERQTRRANQHRHTEAECGTVAGHRQHIRRDETPCGDCSERNRRYERDQASARRRLDDRRQAACGTRAGYIRHRRAGENACDACQQARRDYEHDRRKGAA